MALTQMLDEEAAEEICDRQRQPPPSPGLSDYEQIQELLSESEKKALQNSNPSNAQDKQR